VQLRKAHLERLALLQAYQERIDTERTSMQIERHTYTEELRVLYTQMDDMQKALDRFKKFKEQTAEETQEEEEEETEEQQEITIDLTS
jgi:hypothetical protein